MEENQYVKINKFFLKGFLVGIIIAAPIFIGGTYLLSGNSSNANSNVNNNQPPAQEKTTLEFKINDKSHTLGNEKATVQMVLYNDFECSFCSRHYETVKQIIEEYNDDVFIVFKHFPLSFHQNAVFATEAAECAGEQGKFWEYTDELFANQPNFASQPWGDIASNLGLDANKFQTCLDSEKYKNLINVDLNEGLKNGVEGTPATFINGELVSGALPFANFKAIIDSFLE